MDVMQGQEKWDYVILGPGPGFDQCYNLCVNRLMCTNHAFGFISGAAGKQYHGSSFWKDLRQLTSFSG